MKINNSYEDLDKCENNEASSIFWNIDSVPRSEFIYFYHDLLGKLRHGGRLHLKGTSLSLFCKHVLHYPEKRKDLVNKIEHAKSFHDVKEVEIIMKDQLDIESIWLEDENFNIVGVRP